MSSRNRYTSIKIGTPDHKALKKQAKTRFGGATIMETIGAARRLLEKADPEQARAALREVREEGMQPEAA